MNLWHDKYNHLISRTFQSGFDTNVYVQCARAYFIVLIALKLHIMYWCISLRCCSFYCSISIIIFTFAMTLMVSPPLLLLLIRYGMSPSNFTAQNLDALLYWLHEPNVFENFTIISSLACTAYVYDCACSLFTRDKFGLKSVMHCNYKHLDCIWPVKP